jgi:hypothetical protein
MSSGSSDPDGGQSLGRDRARLINERLIEMFNVRAKCERARSLEGELSTEHHLAFHNSIRDVFHALRPLRDEDAVQSFWEEETLSPRWGDWQEATKDDPEAVPIDSTEDGDPIFAVWQPYEGLDRLDDLRNVVQNRDVTKNVFGGQSQETVKRPNPLPYDVLLDISMTLEDAAAQLGFAPETGVPDETDPAPV